ncbi:MAG: hypothetical protein Q9207_008457 [Kuettlingeria erythrocarpa]
MDRSHRLEAIQEGKFLSLQSDVSIDSTARFHDAHERPFVVPEHDPEGSIYKSRYSKYLASKQSLSQLTCSSLETSSGGQGQDDNTTANESAHSGTPHPATAPRYGPIYAGLQGSPANPPPYSSPPPRPPRPATLGKRTAAKISRFSMTPSMVIEGGCLPPDPSYPSTFDVGKMVSREPGKISPMHIVKLPGQANPESAPPDGGTLAWLQVLAGFFVVMDAQGLNQSYGVFQAYYESVLLRTHSPSTIAWIGSLQIFLLFFMSIVVSGQIDKGRFRHCFTGGSGLLVASTLATSWCKEYWQFVLAQGMGTGVGMGLVFGAGAQVMMTYFTRHLGVATGIASAGGAVGGMVFPAICEKLIARVGFAWTVRGEVSFLIRET